MDELKEKMKRNLEIMEDAIAMHENSTMSNEGVFIEEIDETPIKKSFTERISEVLNTFQNK